MVSMGLVHVLGVGHIPHTNYLEVVPVVILSGAGGPDDQCHHSPSHRP